MSATLIIDDDDPAVQYNPAWALAGGPGYGQAYNLTLHRATEVGQSVTVVFRGTPSQVPVTAVTAFGSREPLPTPFYSRDRHTGRYHASAF